MTSLIRRDGYGTWDPWRFMEETEARIRDWMDTPLGLTPVHRAVGAPGAYVPPVDVYETENELFVFASVPGIDVESVEVKAQNNLLQVSGEQTPVFAENQQISVRAHLTGIPRFGRFSFAVSLPIEVDWNSAEARYQDGLLRVRFNKPESAKPVRIPLTGHQAGTAKSTDPQKQIEAKPVSGRKR